MTTETARHENRFMGLLRQLNAKRWCTDPHCTTCGAMPFRSAFNALYEHDLRGLADDLASMDLTELQQARGWDGALRIVFDCLDEPGLRERVFNAWLEKLDAQPRIADFVLFHYMRHGSLFGRISNDLLSRWVEQCEAIALESSDASLVESLVYTLGDGIRSNRPLTYLVDRLADRSEKVRSACQRSGVCLN